MDSEGELGGGLVSATAAGILRSNSAAAAGRQTGSVQSAAPTELQHQAVHGPCGSCCSRGWYKNKNIHVYFKALCSD